MDEYKKTNFWLSVAYYFLVTVINTILITQVLFQTDMPSLWFILIVSVILLVLSTSAVTWLTKSSMTILKFFNPKAVVYVLAFYFGLMFALGLLLFDLLKGLV